LGRYFVLDKYNTWADWNLVLTAKDITPPEPKTNYISLDGMHGTLDLTEALTGEVTFNDRTINASFWTCEGTPTERARLLKTITTALHGKKIKVIEPDDPYHYYYGRLMIKKSVNIMAYMEFEVEIICEPWRYAIAESERLVEVNGSAVDVVICNNGVKTLTPTVTVTDEVTISYADATVTLTEGSYRITNLKLYQGTNLFHVEGNGSVTFAYTEADL
jgi:phage-related protein